MCFAILGLKIKGIRIKNPSCVKKTFPNFFQKLAGRAPSGLGATILDARGRPSPCARPNCLPIRRHVKSNPIVIAIDGTSASGKSTNAKLVAKALGYHLCRYRRHVPHAGLARAAKEN